MMIGNFILLMCCLGGLELHADQRPQWTYVEGGVTRGDTSHKKLALIFTGGDYGEGTGHVLNTLAAHRIKASFFFNGHYLGPHSDAHALYCPWEDRKKTLVTKDFFQSDLRKNIGDLRKLGADLP